MTDPVETAAAAHFALLRATLRSMGRGAAAEAVEDHLALVEIERAPQPDGGERVSFLQCQRLGVDTQRHNARDGALIGWHAPFVSRLGDGGLSEDEALAVARNAAAPPEDAVLAAAEFETIAGVRNFRARWRRVVGGVPVEGDHIEVMVNTRARVAYFLSRSWRALSSAWIER